MTAPFKPMLSTVDPDGLLEFSVVFTDRSLNHMSKQFQQVMKDLNAKLKAVYNTGETGACVLVPGGGSYGMEAVARQFLSESSKCLVLRQGWFSYRWTQINDASKLTNNMEVLKARREDASDAKSQWAPVPIAEAVQKIQDMKPDYVVTPHVETSSGIALTDEYIAELAKAAHSVGALFFLDCVASGCLWIDMSKLGVDVLITAPQKGWSATPSCGVVMMSEAAVAKMATTKANSFVLDLAKWHSIMGAYLGGAHAYHATLPTDALKQFRDTIVECEAFGLEKLRQAQIELGKGAVDVLAAKGFKSIAKPEFQGAGVLVCYTDDDELKSGKKFGAKGVQIAAGVPLQCDEPAEFKTFRLGLFGLEKLKDVKATLALLEQAVGAATQ